MTAAYIWVTLAKEICIYHVIKIKLNDLMSATATDIKIGWVGLP